MQEKIILFLFALLPLASCSSIEKLPDLFKVQKVSLAANLAADCDEPVEVNVGDDVNESNIKNTAALKDCGARHKMTVEIWPDK